MPAAQTHYISPATRGVSIHMRRIRRDEIRSREPRAITRHGGMALESLLLVIVFVLALLLARAWSRDRQGVLEALIIVAVSLLLPLS
jgi:hypothetical protein